MIALYKLQLFVHVLLLSILALPVSVVSVPITIGNWTVIPSPGENRSLEAITVSTNYLWGIDNRTASGTRATPADNNVVYCQRPCGDASSWGDAMGQLEQTIDANEDEVWGVNNRGQIYKRPIDGSGGWVQITGGNDVDCSGKCFADASVSNNGYIWAISRENETYMLCQGGVSARCGNSDRMLIDNELSLIHIEAGNEEVWAVNATNHIFKRPINGSGNWSIVPGEMRYISASGNAHIWGIAPNNSLYVCEKPCTGDWLYVGGCFQQIDGGINSVVGVTSTINFILSMSLEGVNSNSITAECPTRPILTTSEPQTTTEPPITMSISSPVTQRESATAATSTIIASVAGVLIFIVLLLLILSGIVLSCYSRGKKVKMLNLHASRGKKMKMPKLHASRGKKVKMPKLRVSRGKKVETSNLSQDETSVRGIPNRIAMTEFSVQSSFKLNLPPHLIITASSVKLNEIIGQGEFGIVYKAHIVKHKDGQVVTETMAVKTLKGFHEKTAVKELLKECSKMYTLDHPNVLTLRGVCLDGGTAPYIIMPFMANGSLLAYLKNNRSTLIVSQEGSDDEEVDTLRKRLMDMCFQIAKGMEYLTAMKVVHRDLAARNCMIDVNFIIKVADFGLSESIEMKEYFRQDKDVAIKLPLKWLAPECLDDYIFSEKSDVWAYGVTCWEIFSVGKAPYPGIVPTRLPRMLSEGHRLEKPINTACNDEMYAFMLQCWKFEPDERPSFSHLVNSLSQSIEVMAGYMDVFAFGKEASQVETIAVSGTQ